MRFFQASPIGLILAITFWFSLATNAGDPADEYFTLGLTFFQNRQFVQAVDAYSQAIDHRPGFTKAYYNRAVARLNLNLYQQAIFDYNVVILDDPGHLKAHIYRGFCHLKKGLFDKARLDFDFVIAKDPSQTDALFNRGIAFMKEGRYPQAINDFTETLRYKPEHLQALFSRGFCYSQNGAHHLALTDYNQQVRINPNHTEVYLNKGNTEVRLELYQEAILSYNMSISYHPSNSEGYQGRAFAYLNLMQYARAVEDFSKAIQMNGMLMANYKNRAMAYSKLEETGAALKDLTTYLASVPHDHEALVLQGELLNAIESFEEAKTSLDHAIEINHQYARAYLVRGYTHQRLGNRERALDDYSKLLSQEADNQNALFNRGNLLFEAGVWTNAISDFDRLIMVNSSYGEAYLMRAKAKINDENVSEGCIDLKKARSLGVAEAKEIIIRYCR